MLAKLAFPSLIIISVLIIIALQYGFLFVLLALLPSILWYFYDYIAGKPTFAIIFACNISATLPWIIPIIMADSKSRSYMVAQTMYNPTAWVSIYGCAAAGWAFIYISKTIARYFTEIKMQKQVEVMKSTQIELVEEWGEQIKPKPADAVDIE